MTVHVALFVPCYVDQLFPRVAWATVEVLERHGCTVSFPAAQGCCGQPLVTAGDRVGAARLARRFRGVFAGDEPVVAPSASCVATVRRRHDGLLAAPGDTASGSNAAPRVFELCEFLVDVLGVQRAPGRFPHRVGLHPSCHGLRELGLGTSSETRVARRDPARALLGSLEGLQLVAPDRPDECCGFGGSFAASEAEVSCRMGSDRVRSHRRAGAEVVAATDVSCLVHMGGVARREGEPLRMLHVAEILAEAAA